MSNELIGVIGLIVMLILIGLRMYIGALLGVVGFFGIMLMKNWDVALNVLASSPFAQLNSYTLTVIPMFTLMGAVVAATRIGPSLYETAHSWVGHFRGGLASATVVASGMLGAITGGHYVATVVMAKIALPEMKKRNYDESLAAASIAASAPLAIIIPPSLPFIMYGIMTELSIGKLFMSGVIPGIIQVFVYMLLISILCRRNPNLGPRGRKYTFKERLHSMRGAIAMIILFVLVLGSIYKGICTTTEAGCVGVVGAFAIAACMRDLSLKKIADCFKETALNTGMIMLLLIGTYIFITFISLSKIPMALTNFVVNLNAPIGVILVAVALMYFILGMFMPDIPMLLLTVPFIYPVLTAIGVDGLWLGFFIVKLMAIGTITPPIGRVVYILSSASGIPVMKIFKGVMPFLIADAVILLICSVFPVLVTFLPNSM